MLLIAAKCVFSVWNENKTATSHRCKIKWELHLPQVYGLSSGRQPTEILVNFSFFLVIAFFKLLATVNICLFRHSGCGLVASATEKRTSSRTFSALQPFSKVHSFKIYHQRKTKFDKQSAIIIGDSGLALSCLCTIKNIIRTWCICKRKRWRN